MNINDQARFNQVYQAYLNELTLQDKSPKTVDMYSRYLRQLSVFFDTCPDCGTKLQLIWMKQHQTIMPLIPCTNAAMECA